MLIIFKGTRHVFLFFVFFPPPPSIFSFPARSAWTCAGVRSHPVDQLKPVEFFPRCQPSDGTRQFRLSYTFDGRYLGDDRVVVLSRPLDVVRVRLVRIWNQTSLIIPSIVVCYWCSRMQSSSHFHPVTLTDFSKSLHLI